mmetsp:Transcript_26389/g.78350  ORF Transcript_26389/g.78350 Transcript_26389/m.78350 type:complete len:224 (-) Transcript_26389:214-885(-)
MGRRAAHAAKRGILSEMPACLPKRRRVADQKVRRRAAPHGARQHAPLRAVVAHPLLLLLAPLLRTQFTLLLLVLLLLVLWELLRLLLLLLLLLRRLLAQPPPLSRRLRADRRHRGFARRLRPRSAAAAVRAAAAAAATAAAAAAIFTAATARLKRGAHAGKRVFAERTICRLRKLGKSGVAVVPEYTGTVGWIRPSSLLPARGLARRTSHRGGRSPAPPCVRS